MILRNQINEDCGVKNAAANRAWTRARSCLRVRQCVEATRGDVHDEKCHDEKCHDESAVTKIAGAKLIAVGLASAFIFSSAVFSPSVAAVGARCGGFAGLTCGKHEFCQHPTGLCFFPDIEGTCVKRPTLCPKIYMPVCGCDNKTYSNDCERNGVSKAHDGACF
jgi:Kazal-type serine protease inhibitor domain